MKTIRPHIPKHIQVHAPAAGLLILLHLLGLRLDGGAGGAVGEVGEG